MNLLKKLATLIKAGPPRPSSRPAGIPRQRPTPLDDRTLPLDPAEGWGIQLSPAGVRDQLVSDFIEQLALEAALNGEAFFFSDKELNARFTDFFTRLVETGQLERRDSGEVKPPPGGPERWIEAQQVRIERLRAWWRAHGGPDIEPRVM